FVLMIWYKHSHPDFSMKVFFQYLRSPNRDYRNLSQLSYFTILGGIGITLQIIFFFYSFKFLGVVVTVIGFPISLLLVTIFSRETMDFFKGIYLAVLVIATILIGVGRFDVAADSLMNPAGWLSLIIFTLSMTFLMNQMVRDPLNPWETELIIKTHSFYKILRPLIKTGCMFLIAAAFAFPIAGLFMLFPATSVFQQDAAKFWGQLSDLGPLFISSQGFFLIFGATVIPWSIFFVTQAYWDRESLPFDTWGSILAILEPLGSIFFGVLIIQEQFPLIYLFVVMLLLTLSILLRYVHETSDKVLAYVGVRLVPQQEKQVYEDLFHLKDIITIYSVVGDFDLILFVRAMNVLEFNKLVREKLQSNPGIEQVDSFLVEDVLK
ncbi:MAG TPA: Lrp/AsnC ligand binding domain-containing protein, partial [Candidatus Lokiarchaeia archaeon]|nr:Lrp/AsnC ligand binding domain-containing protein [Candidatus Lokiarchaeia archaeon]